MITPKSRWLDAVTTFFKHRKRQFRNAASRARLQRELSTLPTYIARDIGAATNQDRFINCTDC